MAGWRKAHPPLLVTHFHPDHVGLAGWLHARTGAEIQMSRWNGCRPAAAERVPQEWCRSSWPITPAAGAPAFLAFLERRGLLYPRWVGPLPRRYHRLKRGDVLTLAGPDGR